VRADGTPFPGDEHPASITLRHGVEVRDEVMGVRRPDGQLRWILVTSAPILAPDGALDGCVATFVDISGEYELRARLEESLRRLGGTIREHAALAAAITHDLATPAAATRLYADVLADLLAGSPAGRTGSVTTVPSDTTHVVGGLRQSAHRVEELIRNLGEVATRLQLHDTRTRVDTDVVGIVRRVCARADHAVDVVVEPGGEHRAEVDVIQIERIVDNLVGNAVKHANPRGPICVTVRPSDASVTITVDDDGVGIDVDERERVFEPFARLDGASGTPGSGVGLYLVREFARFHGGDVRCDRSPLGGSRFEVRIAREAGASTRPG
jgi:signal transduction histidine kinase